MVQSGEAEDKAGCAGHGVAAPARGSGQGGRVLLRGSLGSAFSAALGEGFGGVRLGWRNRLTAT